MATPAQNRVPVTLIPSHRAILEERAKVSGLPVATLAGLLLRRAIEEVRKDDGLFYRVLLGSTDDPQDNEAALSASLAMVEAMERGEGSKPVTVRPTASGKPASGKRSPARKAVGKPKRRAAR